MACVKIRPTEAKILVLAGRSLGAWYQPPALRPAARMPKPPRETVRVRAAGRAASDLEIFVPPLTETAPIRPPDAVRKLFGALAVR